MVVVKKFYNLFYIFIISSVLGYIIEFLWTFFVHGMLINHSAVVIGPFNFAYGICAIMLTILLYKYKNDNYFKIFVLSFVGGSILEYIMSFGMELVLEFTAWDYSNYFLNINGRICFLYSLFWGLLGVLWIKLIITNKNSDFLTTDCLTNFSCLTIVISPIAKIHLNNYHI